VSDVIGGLVLLVLGALAITLRATRWRTPDPRRVCTCGHIADAHEHWRPGTDCGLCTCNRYRRGARHRPAAVEVLDLRQVIADDAFLDNLSRADNPTDRHLADVLGEARADLEAEISAAVDRLIAESRPAPPS
jgi:hypothetical protein